MLKNRTKSTWKWGSFFCVHLCVCECLCVFSCKTEFCGSSVVLAFTCIGISMPISCSIYAFKLSGLFLSLKWGKLIQTTSKFSSSFKIWIPWIGFPYLIPFLCHLLLFLYVFCISSFHRILWHCMTYTFIVERIDTDFKIFC